MLEYLEQALAVNMVCVLTEMVMAVIGLRVENWLLRNWLEGASEILLSSIECGKLEVVPVLLLLLGGFLLRI